MSNHEPIIKSMLDDDLYKLTQCQAVCEKYPRARARYKFINRGLPFIGTNLAEMIRDEVDALADIQLFSDEAQWLRDHCPFLTPVFIDFLKGYRYNPNEVYIEPSYGTADASITIEGPWYRTILWEVKLMAIISELYFRHTSYNKLAALSRVVHKISSLHGADITIGIADFGTRRRFSARHHNKVVETLATNLGPLLVGTSNMHLAMKHNLKPIGTQAHEWFMFHGAKYGYKDANRMAMQKWVDVFHGNLGIALSDTYTSDVFFKSFGSKYAKLFDGVRHDSGDPIDFIGKAIAHYKSLGIDPSTKTIVFSDGLSPEKALRIAKYCRRSGIRYSFGIGTNLTNDIEGVKPLNMVIKMSDCKPYDTDEWQPVVKLSDSPGKHTGNPEQVELCKKLLGI